ncbi:MAG: retention module-containing protein, partial [Azoarcus sp.]|nr:retention module-containing protein [Azoarcus sp.]
MANAQVVATVVSITGKAEVRDQEGNLRTLKAGDTLLEGETLVTAAGAHVELLMVADGSVVPVGEVQSVLVTADLAEPTRPQANEAQLADGTIQQVIQALNDGTNLDDVLEDPAAGLTGGSGGDGNDFVRLLRITEGVDPLAFEFAPSAAAVVPELRAAGDVVDEQPAVTLVNDPPTIDVSANAFVEGSASAGAVAGTYTVADPDNTTAELTVSFTGNSNSGGYYALENGQVVLTPAGAALVNGGGTLPAIELTVTDPGNLTGT